MNLMMKAGSGAARLLVAYFMYVAQRAVAKGDDQNAIAAANMANVIDNITNRTEEMTR